jgi:hypothetical protein
MSLGRGDKLKIQRQVEFYKAVGVPRNGSLISSGILMRQKHPDVIQFCKTWWHQVHNWSERDQIAYGYAQHKYPDAIANRIDWNYQTQNEFIHIPHLHKKWRGERLKEVMEKYGTKGN